MSQNDLSLQDVYELQGGVQHYAWGEDCSNAEGGLPYIARLLNQAPGNETWAELWLGAHPKMPSKVVVSDGEPLPLGSVIGQNPVGWLGRAAIEETGEEQLPYLLKVLTCRHPLSIQSHPDRKTARHLHLSAPNLYPDSNDKAEVIIAIGQFEAMAGFRNFMMALEDLRRLTTAETLLQLLQSVEGTHTPRQFCDALFNLSAIQVASLLSGMEYELTHATFELRDADKLFLQLLAEYPGDRGTVFAYLLNHLHLQPGEAVFLEPNSPHAYLNGCGVECMSNSDNVIRAGLTGKPVDVVTLLKTVNFDGVGAKMIVPDEKKMECGTMSTYHLPTPKFQVSILKDARMRLPEEGGCAIFLVLEGVVRLETPAGERLADHGTAWVCPASFREVTFSPATPHTMAVLATSCC